LLRALTPLRNSMISESVILEIVDNTKCRKECQQHDRHNRVPCVAGSPTCSLVALQKRITS